MMEKKLCLCSKHILNTQDVTYLVPLHGEPTPACSHACYRMWVEREALVADLRRREEAARMDAMPREIYAAYDYADER